MIIGDARIESWNPAVVLKLAPLVRLDDDQLFAFCQLNRDLRIERDAEGVLVLMAPVGGASSARNWSCPDNSPTGPSAMAAAWPLTPRRASSSPMARCDHQMPRGSVGHAGMP